MNDMTEDEAAYYNRSLRHQAMEWAASTANGSFLHPAVVIERAETFLNYVRDGQTGDVVAGEFDLNESRFLAEPSGAKIDDMQWAAIDEQMTHHHLIAKAKRIVFNHVKIQLEKTDTHVTFSGDEVYVVWFCKTLQNWKALVSTTLPDGMYYEVTYDGDRHTAYLDAYKKFQNVIVQD